MRNLAIRRFIFIIILAIVGILLSVFSFNIPFTTSRWKGFANSISMGIDIKGGVVAVYEAKDEGEAAGSLKNKIDATKARISALLSSKGYTEAQITTQGTNQIRIEIADVDDPEKIFELIGTPADLRITDKGTLKEAKEVGARVITGKDIKSVKYAYNNETGQHGVSLEFTSTGTTLFATLTSELAANGQSLHIYLDDKSETPFSSPTVQNAITDGKTFISGSMNNKKEAEDYALKILSGTYAVKLELKENSIISPTLGTNALTSSIIAGVIGIALIFIFMALIYRALGLIANLVILIYGALMLLFLAIIPYVQLTLPGIAGIILSLGMALDANIIIFEKIKEEYRKGKKIPTAFQDGFKRSVWSIVDANITSILAAVILALFGTGAIKGFAITLLIGVVLSLFTSLVVTRYLLSLSSKINATKAKAYGLVREKETEAEKEVAVL